MSYIWVTPCKTRVHKSVQDTDDKNDDDLNLKNKLDEIECISDRVDKRYINVQTMKWIIFRVDLVRWNQETS